MSVNKIMVVSEYSRQSMITEAPLNMLHWCLMLHFKQAAPQNVSLRGTMLATNRAMLDWT